MGGHDAIQRVWAEEFARRAELAAALSRVRRGEDYHDTEHEEETPVSLIGVTA